MPDEHLQQAIARARPEADADTELPDLAAGYQAHARPSNRPVYSLHCVRGKQGVQSFQYVHLDSASKFEADDRGHVLSLRFCGSRHWEITIRGRNLWRLYDYIHQHRMPWVQQADRDFAADKEPIVSAISVTLLTDRRGPDPESLAKQDGGTNRRQNN
jgi:hypothetical protein